jgi:prophage DNA circulation protein
MGFWESGLMEASFAGITFPVGDRALVGGRAFARHRPAYASGQRTEDQGRDPYVVQLTIPLFRGVSEDHYPGIYDQLRLAFDDPETGGVAEFVDPELGPYTARVGSWKWATDPELRDGGIFTVTFEEEGDAAGPIESNVSRATASSVESAADDADAELSALGITAADVVQAIAAGGFPATSRLFAGTPIGSIVTNVVEKVNEAEATAAAVTGLVEQAASQIGIVAQLAGDQPDGAVAFGRLFDTINALRAWGEARASAAGPLLSLTTTSPTSVYELAAMLYGDASRVDEVLAAVPTMHPGIVQPGTSAQVRTR